MPGEVRRSGLVEGGQIPLGVDLAGEGTPTLLGAKQGEGSGDCRLTHAALAGDEDEATFEQARRLRALGAVGVGPHTATRAQGAPKPTLRSVSGAPTST